MEIQVMLTHCVCFLLMVVAETFSEHEKHIYNTLENLEASTDIQVAIETTHAGRFRRDSPGNETNYITEEVDHSYYRAVYYPDYQIDAIQRFCVDFEDANDPYIQTQNRLSSNHRNAVILPMSFRFPFYGHDVGRAVVATGGFIYVGPYIHKWLASSQYVAPLMANFDPSFNEESIVRTRDNGTMFSTEWKNVFLQDHIEAGNFTFQTSIFPDGTIAFCYQNVAKDVSTISERSHPVTIGLSDAFYHDKPLGGGMIQRTIYEYHSFALEYNRISSGSVVVMEPLPTCHQFKSCDTCTSSAIGFNCSWCEVTKRCSSGFDRNRQEWVENRCDEHGVEWQHQCPRTTTPPSTTTPKRTTTTPPPPTTAAFTTQSEMQDTTTLPLPGVDPCSKDPCFRGRCLVVTHNQFRCDCDKGFTGTYCSLNIDDCASGPCMNGGKCVDKVNDYYCDCTPGFGGDTCLDILKVDYCVDIMPCENGATCENRPDGRGYHCTCQQNWYGKNCQKRVTDKENPNTNLLPAKQVQDGSKSNVGGGVNTGAIFAVLVILSIIAVVVGWTFYAYKNPTTKSGLFLIEMKRCQCFNKKDPEDRYQVNLDKVEGEAEA